MVKWQWRHRILTCVSRTSTSWRCMQSLIECGLPGRGAHVGEKLATSLQACADFRDGFSCAFTVRKGRNSQAPEKNGRFSCTASIHTPDPRLSCSWPSAGAKTASTAVVSMQQRRDRPADGQPGLWCAVWQCRRAPKCGALDGALSPCPARCSARQQSESAYSADDSGLLSRRSHCGNPAWH